MRRSDMLRIPLALVSTLALSSGAFAFGAGHFGGGGSMGGFGGAYLGGAPSIGRPLSGPSAVTHPSPTLQTGRSVAIGGPTTQGLPDRPAGIGAPMGSHWDASRHHRGWRGGGGGGFGYDALGYGIGADDVYGGDVGYNEGDDGLETGRSVAEAGRFCATPIRTCSLATPRFVGEPCSCRVHGGRSGGHVAD